MVFSHVPPWVGEAQLSRRKRFEYLVIPLTDLSVRVLADLVEGRWSGVATAALPSCRARSMLLGKKRVFEHEAQKT